MHGYRSGGEPTGLEEVLGETMTRKDMGIEPGYATLAEEIHDVVPHLLAE
jgi:hypothetical protein